MDGYGRTMEGYVFALMGNSGTDPDLEEEEEEKFRALREKELALRYLIKTGEDVEEEEGTETSNSQARRYLGQEVARLVAEPAVTAQSTTEVNSGLASHGRNPETERGDHCFCLSRSHYTDTDQTNHYSVVLPPGHKMFPPDDIEYISPSEISSPTARFSLLSEDDEESDGLTGGVGGAGIPSYLIKLSSRDSKTTETRTRRDLTRPAMFHRAGACRVTDNLPSLRMSYPNHPRTLLPMAPKPKSISAQVNLFRRQQKAFTATCSRPPSWPAHRLMKNSYELLRGHYESLGQLCLDVNHIT